MNCTSVDKEILKEHIYFHLILSHQRSSSKSSKTRELDRGQTVFVFSVEGMVPLGLAFSATLDAVPSPPYRAHYHSLLRLKDAYTQKG